MGVKVAMDFSPEKYGMTFCHGCSGKGHSDESQGGRDICRICGGFGFIKKENFGKEQNQNEILRMAKKITFSPLRSKL